MRICQEDAEDLHTVAKYFENQGYDIWAIVGHSRGSVAGLKYAATCEKPLAHFVNVSGRYKMNDNQIYKNRPEIGAALDKQVTERKRGKGQRQDR